MKLPSKQTALKKAVQAVTIYKQIKKRQSFYEKAAEADRRIQQRIRGYRENKTDSTTNTDSNETT